MEDVEMKDLSHQMSHSIRDNANANANHNLPFIEKYRPQGLDDIISHTDILSTVNLFIEKKSIPHFLFHGPPGTGKTSCILALARQIYGDAHKANTLELNASDDRGINVVREKIKEFCNSINVFSQQNQSAVSFKLVILDEADMMTAAAQFALRRVIEKYTKNVRFCLICNQVNKIIPAIQSRCMRFRFSPLKKDQCYERLIQICFNEGIKYSLDAIHKVVEIGKGDMRKILNLLESTSMAFGEITVNNVYSCAGLPSPNQIKAIIQIMCEKPFGEAYETINDIKLSNGFSMGDLIVDLIKYVRAEKRDMNLDDKIEAYKAFQKMDYLYNIGGNDKIILTALISSIRKINMIN